MARQRFTHPLIAGSLYGYGYVQANFPNSIMATHSFFDVFHGYDHIYNITDETINLNSILADANETDKLLVELDYILASSFDPNQATLPIAIYTGADSTGTQFSLIKDDADFGASTLLEAKVYNFTGGIDFNIAQLNNAGIRASSVYVTYRGSHSNNSSASRMAQFEVELRAVQTELQEETGTAGEALAAHSLGYVKALDGKIYAFVDPTDITQCNAIVFVQDACPSGNVCYITINGEVDPSFIPVVGRQYFAGNNSEFTYIGDSSGNELVSGDYRIKVGKCYDADTIIFDVEGADGMMV